MSSSLLISVEGSSPSLLVTEDGKLIIIFNAIASLQYHVRLFDVFEIKPSFLPHGQ